MNLGNINNGNGGMDGIGSAHGESISFLFQGREVSVPSAVLSQCGKSIIGIDASSDPVLPSSSRYSLCMDSFDSRLSNNHA